MAVVVDNVEVRDGAVALLLSRLILKLLQGHSLGEGVNAQDFGWLQKRTRGNSARPSLGRSSLVPGLESPGWLRYLGLFIPYSFFPTESNKAAHDKIAKSELKCKKLDAKARGRESRRLKSTGKGLPSVLT